MARPTNGNMTSIAEAKAHLLDLGRRDSATVLGVPIAQAGALLAVGALLGRLLAPCRKDRIRNPVGDLALRAGLSVVPLLIQQLIGCCSKHTAAIPSEESKTTRDEPPSRARNPA
jgi:hypothetical protein